MTAAHTTASRIPEEIRCRWWRRKGTNDTHDCKNCGCWTSNLPLYENSVCPAKDRRTATTERRRK